MPRIGRPAACALAQRVDGRRAETVHRRARGADAGEDGQVGASSRSSVSSRAEAAERELDGADVAGPVARDRDVHISPFVDGSTRSRGAAPHARRARSP